MEGNQNLTKVIAGVAALAIIAGGIVLFTSSSDDDEADTTAATTTTQTENTADVAPVEDAIPNIVETAVSVDDLSTLVTAVQAAGLVETLSDEDASFTVFAPNNAAFDALPEGTLEGLLEEDAKEDLADVLTYHVVPSAVLSSELTDGQVIETVNGQTLTVAIADGVVTINGATVLTPDVQTSNGVVHVIDSVLLPEAGESSES